MTAFSPSTACRFPFRLLCAFLAAVFLATAAPAAAASPALDLNTANADQLAELPGIGPALAERILEYRGEHGPFASVDGLLQVKGIGKKTLAKFRNKIRVDGAAAKAAPSKKPPEATPPAATASGGKQFTPTELFGPPARLSDSLSVFFSTPAIETDPPVDQVFAAVLDKVGRTVDGAFFEINAEPVVAAFERAAKRGVRVRLVTDGDELEAEPEIVARLTKAGVQLVADDRAALMHDKFAILDGQQIWTGSYNLTRNCTSKNDNNALWLRPKELAAIYQAAFDKLWKGDFGPGKLKKPSNSATLQDGTIVEVYFAPEESVELHVMNALRRAKKSIDVMAFSFTDEAMGEALISGAMRGLKIRVVIEKLASDAKGGQLAALQSAGVTAIPDGNKFRLHHKVFLVDGETVITGSFNFSKSARGNNENLLILRNNAGLSKAFAQEFERVLAVAKSAQ